MPAAGSCGTAKERMEGHVEGVKCENWFFCTKHISADAVESAIRAAEMHATARLRGLSRCGPTHTGLAWLQSTQYP